MSIPKMHFSPRRINEHALTEMKIPSSFCHSMVLSCYQYFNFVFPQNIQFESLVPKNCYLFIWKQIFQGKWRGLFLNLDNNFIVGQTELSMAKLLIPFFSGSPGIQLMFCKVLKVFCFIIYHFQLLKILKIQKKLFSRKIFLIHKIYNKYCWKYLRSKQKKLAQWEFSERIFFTFKKFMQNLIDGENLTINWQISVDWHTCKRLDTVCRQCMTNLTG